MLPHIISKCYCSLLLFLSSALATSNDVITIPKDSDQCNQLHGLAKKQKKVCRRNADVMSAVKMGAARAINECQWQFRARRWNCSYVDANTVFGSSFSQGTYIVRLLVLLL